MKSEQMIYKASTLNTCLGDKVSKTVCVHEIWHCACLDTVKFVILCSNPVSLFPGVIITVQEQYSVAAEAAFSRFFVRR